MRFWDVTVVFNRKLKGHSDTFPRTRLTTVKARVSIDDGEIGKPNPQCNADFAVNTVMEENDLQIADLVEVHSVPCGPG